MEVFWFIIGAVVVYALFILYGKYEESRKKKWFISRLKKEYGAVPEREYSEERLNALTGYYRKHIDSLADVDDITWNDIDGNRLFKRINYCYSSSGEEYLYYRLRTLRFAVDEAERLALENRLSQIDSNEEKRIHIQLLFAKLGRTGKYSIFQYLEWLDNIKEKSILGYWLMLLGYPACVGLILITPPLGVVLLLFFCIFRIALYFNARKEIEPYLISFAYLIRTFHFVDKLTGNSFVNEVWPDEIKRLKLLRKQVRGISSFQMLFLSNGVSDDVFDSIKQYINGLTYFDLISFYSMLKTVRRYKNEIDEMITLLGRMEAEISIASFRRSLPYYAVPVFEEKRQMKMEDCFHPLIKEPVSNSFEITGGMLLTGSNASGKSTFLKTVEIAAILAQTIQTVCASSYKSAEFRIFSSMTLRDNLENSESYYIVEIKAIKRMLDAKAKQDGRMILCFVDEVLRGTNTVERISAAAEILRTLSDKNVLSFAATHDVELTGILADLYDNFHFEEEVTNEDVTFAYRLLKGPARTRNAIKLLKLMGYPELLTQQAEKRALKLLAEKVDLHGELNES